MCPPRSRAAKLTAVALLMTAAIAQPAHAGAAVITISPGDRIATGTSSCTLGYAYTGQDDHTYAITAGPAARV
jgi:hypothetical protein